jgi:hypothetical protein
MEVIEDDWSGDDSCVFNPSASVATATSSTAACSAACVRSALVAAGSVGPSHATVRLEEGVEESQSRYGFGRVDRLIRRHELETSGVGQLLSSATSA